MFGTPSAPAATAPPPPPPGLAQPSIMQAGLAERKRLNAAAGGGMDGTSMTGGQGAAAPKTTKTLLGS